MSGEFDSRKDSHSTKFKQRPQISIKLSFRELFVWELPGLHYFDNMAIITWVKKIGQKRKGTLWVHETPMLEVIFWDPHWQLIYHNNWCPGTSEISTPPKIVVWAHFHVQHGTKTTLVFLTADEAVKNTRVFSFSWLLLPCSVSLLLCSTLQTRKQLFLYPQEARSGLRKLLKDKHQH